MAYLSKFNDHIQTEDFDQKYIIDEVSSTLTYIGFAPPGSSESNPIWKIYRASVSGTITKVEYANGNSGYLNIWANRASITYS